MSSSLPVEELNALAEALVQQRDYNGARDVYLQLLAMLSPGEDSESKLAAVAQRITLLKVIIRLDVLAGGSDASVQRAEEVLCLTAELYGSTHRETLAAMADLASYLRKGSPYQQEESEQLYAQVIHILSSSSASSREGSDELPKALMGYGMTLEAMGGKDAQAVQAYEKALALRRAALGDSAAETGDTLLCLAMLLGRQSDEPPLAAAIRFEQAYGTYVACYGDYAHPRVRLCAESLQGLLRRQAGDLASEDAYCESLVVLAAADAGVTGAPAVAAYMLAGGSEGFGRAAKECGDVFVAVYPLDTAAHPKSYALLHCSAARALEEQRSICSALLSQSALLRRLLLPGQHRNSAVHEQLLRREDLSCECSAEEGGYCVSLACGGQLLLRVRTRDKAVFDEWNNAVFTTNA